MCSNKAAVLILFDTTRLFLRALAIAEERGTPHRVLAIPEHLSSICGMCLGLDADELSALSAALDAANIPYNIDQ